MPRRTSLACSCRAWLSGFAKQCWLESGPSLALGAARSSHELGLLRWLLAPVQGQTAGDQLEELHSSS